jgi:two-component system sensor histidine kinase/response regulator
MNKISEETYQLLDNLTKWEKISQNKIQPHKQRTDIISLVEGIIAVYEPIAELKNVTITLSCIDSQLHGSIDIDMMKTIIRNLLSNAIDYSFEGGPVSVSIEVEDENINFRIKDTGIGIKEEDKDRLFSRTFYMNLGNKSHHSYGFGVYVAKSFVELHGGSIGFESEEGKGTTFYFTLKIDE